MWKLVVVGCALARNVARKRATYSCNTTAFELGPDAAGTDRGHSGRTATALAGLAAALAVTLAGCATYSPHPLPTAPDLTRAPALNVPASSFHVPGLKPHAFDPAAGLDETAVVMLAVANNPDLKAARAGAGVARAQVFDAGLLPDPQLSAGLSRSPERTGYSIGLGEELGALITRGARRAAAGAAARQVNLDLLWQEWQVAQKARELFIQARADEQLLRLLRPAAAELDRVYRAQAAALRQGNATAATSAESLRALTDAEATLRTTELDGNDTRHALDELLGLAPDVALHLVGEPPLVALPRRQFEAAVAELPHRRADLMALQAGYASQEQRLRAAILAQIPGITAGVQKAKSAEEGINTVGLTINLQLPLFNRNRGQIAIERATRADLRAAYQARLDQAVSEADRVWQAARIMARQAHQLDTALPEVRQTAAAAQRAFRARQMDAGTYGALQANLIAQETQAITLRADLAKADAALQTLLGMPQP